MIANAYPAGPRPAASTMYPIWLIVDAASAFLMSSFAQPMIAPNSSVTAPTMHHRQLGVGRQVEDRVRTARSGTPPR